MSSSLSKYMGSCKKSAKLFQDEKSGISVVKYLGTGYDVAGFITKRTGNIIFNDGMPTEIVAKVKRRDPDRWDAATGAKAAYRKADAIHNRYFKRGLKNWCEYCLKQAFAVSPELTEEVYKEMTEKRKEDG